MTATLVIIVICRAMVGGKIAARDMECGGGEPGFCKVFGTIKSDRPTRFPRACYSHFIVLFARVYISVRAVSVSTFAMKMFSKETAIVVHMAVRGFSSFHKIGRISLLI